jgi:hypothetical protein
LFNPVAFPESLDHWEKHFFDAGQKKSPEG